MSLGRRVWRLLRLLCGKIFKNTQFAFVCIVFISVSASLRFFQKFHNALDQTATSDAELLSAHHHLESKERSGTARAMHATPEEFNIFYNIFIPDDQGQQGIDNAMEIVEEQINIIGSSYARHNFSVLVHYNTIGSSALNATYMDSLCASNGIRCLHMDHFVGGNENLTIQRVIDYCKTVTDERTRVTYLHSKGSYHPNHFNLYWRKYLTMAVTSEDCMRPPNAACNSCGLQFYPMWTFFFPGNFWTAKCSFINSLPPLEEYKMKLEEINEKIARSGKLKRKLYKWDDNIIGTDRYAAEFWIASSPDVVPCDLSREPNVIYWTMHNHTYDDFEFAMAPRHGVVSNWFMSKPTLISRVVSNPKRSRFEYFLLAGHLVKWKAIYGRIPAKDTWFWKFFPQSDAWQRDIKNGNFEKLYRSIIDVKLT